MTRPWRTNIGLRLTADLGAWLEAHCQRENRTLANYVETLILRDRERFDEVAERQATLSDEGDAQTVETWFDREAVARKLARAFGSLEATEEPCETCRGKGVYLAGDDAGGCDDCAGTGIVYDWDEAEAWRLAADVALSLPALSVPEGWVAVPREVVEPFARAADWEERCIDPDYGIARVRPLKDSRRVAVTLGECRAVRAALSAIPSPGGGGK